MIVISIEYKGYAIFLHILAGLLARMHAAWAFQSGSLLTAALQFQKQILSELFSVSSLIDPLDYSYCIHPGAIEFQCMQVTLNYILKYGVQRKERPYRHV